MKDKKTDKEKKQQRAEENEQAKQEKAKKEKKKPESELEEINKKLEELQEERDEIFSKLQRVSADYANFQKRAPKQIADSVAYEKEKIIKSLLPILDNFEHTLQNAKEAKDVESVVKGVQIVYDQMIGVLKAHEVEKIDAEGQQFDPSLHQAMMQKSEPGVDDNKVVEVFQTGYKLNNRVIRPSKVVVNKAAVLKEEEEKQEEAGKEVEEPEEGKEQENNEKDSE